MPNAIAGGRFPIEIGIGIGLHFGSVGIGPVGEQRYLEQAIVGDTVNVARKLEALTRKVGLPSSSAPSSSAPFGLSISASPISSDYAPAVYTAYRAAQAA